MIGRIDSRSQAAHHPLASVGVTIDFQSHTMRLVYNRNDFFQAQRGTVDQRAVRLPHVDGTGEILGSIDLDVVDAMQLSLTHGGASKPWRIDILAFCESFVKAHRL